MCRPAGQRASIPEQHWRETKTPQPSVRALRHFAPSGIPRPSAFRAVWHFAPFGISRRSAFRAVWHFAPFVFFTSPFPLARAK